MFLADIHQFGLIPSTPEEDILSLFPITVKRTLIKSVVDELHRKEQLRLSGGELTTIITTPAHAEWILECIGQGFRLPFTDGSILNTLFRLYHIWLFNNWPLGMQPRTQHFFRKIGLHFSLLFELRKDDQGMITKESDQLEDSRCRFCYQALKEIYLPIVRLFGPTFSKKTWDAYLKILLVITDTILKSESKKVVSHLATFALRVLIEVWFLARTQDEELWGAMRKLAVEHEWRDRTISVVHQFNEVNAALTARVLSLTYGPQYGSKEIEINFALDAPLSQHELFVIDLSPEDTFFYWYKFLNLLGNHARIKSPEIYRLAFVGIERIVDMYLGLHQVVNVFQVPDETQPDFVPPNATVLLNVYGNWLFEACDKDRPCYEQGTAVAIKTLCDIIFTTTNYQRIQQRHLASFYTCVGQILCKPELNIVSHSLLTSSRYIFTQNIFGTSILIPHYLHAISCVWGSNRSPPEDVGIAAAEILISLACYQNVYWQTAFVNLPFRQTFEGKGVELVNSYIQMLPQIQKILKNALIYEKEVRPLELLIWCFSVTLSELFDYFSAQGERLQPNDQSWVEYIFTELLLDKVVTGGWQHRVSIVVLETFTFIASQSGANIAKYIDTTELSHKLTRGLSSKITKLVNATDDETIHFVTGCFKCIGEWLTCNEAHTLWSVEYSVGVAVMTAIKSGINSPNFLLQDAARQLWGLLFNQTDSHLGNGVSSLLSEIDFLAETATRMGRTNLRGHELWQDYGQTCRVFTLNDNIISIIDVPELPGQIGPPRVNIIIRSMFGKFVWTGQMNLFGNQELPSAVIGTNPTKIDLIPPAKYGHTPIPEVVTFSDVPEIMHRTEWLMDQTQQYLQSINFGLEVPIDFVIPWRPSSELWDPSFEGKSHYTRMFLSHMGLLHPNTFEEANFLSFNENLINALKDLDRIPEREVSNVSVIFWGHGQKTRQQIFSNLIGTNRFHEFLDSLGWLVNLDTHTTYKGDAPNYEIAAPWGLPYWCDNSHEMLFEPSILFENMPKNGSTMDPAMAIEYKREILMKNNFCIVWLENELDLKFPVIEDNFQNKYYIIIIPLNSGLYQVDIKTFDNESFFFLKKAVVSRHILALHIRRIIKIFHNIQNSRTERYYNIFWAQPNYLFRKQFMKVICENHESNLTFEQQLYALMTSSNVEMAQQPRIKKPIPRPVVVNKPEEKEKSISVTNIPTQHVPINEPLTPTSADKADKKDKSKKPKLDALKKTSKRSDKGDEKQSARGEKTAVDSGHRSSRTPREDKVDPTKTEPKPGDKEAKGSARSGFLKGIALKKGGEGGPGGGGGGA